jgi:hypothetical protein
MKKLVIAAVLVLLQISPALAGPGGAGDTEDRGDRRRVEVAFTKWISTYPLLEGYTGDDFTRRTFVGEVLQRQVSQDYDPRADVNAAGRIVRLEAIYEIQAGAHSFTALIRGGSNAAGTGRLDGVILAGWRAGDRVHVQYETLAGCDGAPLGRTCVRGTIQIQRSSED